MRRMASVPEWGAMSGCFVQPISYHIKRGLLGMGRFTQRRMLPWFSVSALRDCCCEALDEALPVPLKWQEQMGIDCKKTARTFMKCNLPPKCMFDYVETVVQGLKDEQEIWCYMHDACCAPCRKRPEKPCILIAGFPCSPYSSQRGDRAERGYSGDSQKTHISVY